MEDLGLTGIDQGSKLGFLKICGEGFRASRH